MMKSTTIHIFSVIPKLSSVISKALPNSTVINVVNGNVSSKYEKVVSEEELTQIQNAEIILGDAHLIAQVYDKLSDAKFVQCTWAGVEKLIDHVKNGVYPKYPIARMGTQTFGQLMAEYTIGQILCHERAWLEAHQYQLQSTWAHKDKIAIYRSFQELTVGVLGVGLIGGEVIRALKYFRCNVLGFGRSPVPPRDLPLDQYFSKPDLQSLLEKCDYIVNILPSTPDTKGLLGNDIFSFAKKKPVFINIGRGDIISEDEIINALDKSWISAAILDVFETEPLSQFSRLWLHPKVTLTPHAAGVSRSKDVVGAFLHNLERFTNGEHLVNVIDWDRGY